MILAEGCDMGKLRDYGKKMKAARDAEFQPGKPPPGGANGKGLNRLNTSKQAKVDKATTPPLHPDQFGARP
jgi:hypothetical protein